MVKVKQFMNLFKKFLQFWFCKDKSALHWLTIELSIMALLNGSSRIFYFHRYNFNRTLIVIHGKHFNIFKRSKVTKKFSQIVQRNRISKVRDNNVGIRNGRDFSWLNLRANHIFILLRGTITVQLVLKSKTLS